MYLIKIFKCFLKQNESRRKDSGRLSTIVQKKTLKSKILRKFLPSGFLLLCFTIILVLDIFQNPWSYIRLKYDSN